MSKASGVFQRCRPDCPARCKQHGWAFLVEVGRDHHGRRRQITRSGFGTARQARQARELVLAQFRSGQLPTDRHQSTGEYLERWYARKAGGGLVRPTTARSYRQHLDAYLLPHLGPVRLADLRPAHIEAMYAAIQKSNASRARPVGPATVRRIHATLSSALRAAVKRGDLAHNPAQHVELPSADRPRVRPWDAATFGAFLDAIEGHRLAPLYHLTGTAGLRRGEACGLRWVDVDLDTAVLIVRQQVVQIGHRTAIGKPKTRSGEDRVVDLDAGTVAALRQWRASQAAERLAWGPAWHDSGLVFTREDGTGYHPQQVTKTFTRLARAAGVPATRYHDLRHLQASLMLAAGVPLPVVSKRLGHSSITITADTYSHLLDGVGRQAAEAAAALIPRRSSGGTLTIP